MISFFFCSVFMFGVHFFLFLYTYFSYLFYKIMLISLRCTSFAFCFICRSVRFFFRFRIHWSTPIIWLAKRTTTQDTRHTKRETEYHITPQFGMKCGYTNNASRILTSYKIDLCLAHASRKLLLI